jgi:hypothetical protein
MNNNRPCILMQEYSSAFNVSTEPALLPAGPIGGRNTTFTPGRSIAFFGPRQAVPGPRLTKGGNSQPSENVLIMHLLVHQHPCIDMSADGNQKAPATWSKAPSVEGVRGVFCSHCPAHASLLHLYHTNVIPFSHTLSASVILAPHSGQSCSYFARAILEINSMLSIINTPRLFMIYRTSLFHLSWDNFYQPPAF